MKSIQYIMTKFCMFLVIYFFFFVSFVSLWFFLSFSVGFVFTCVICLCVGFVYLLLFLLYCVGLVSLLFFCIGFLSFCDILHLFWSSFASCTVLCPCLIFVSFYVGSVSFCASWWFCIYLSYLCMFVLVLCLMVKFFVFYDSTCSFFNSKVTTK